MAVAGAVAGPAQAGISGSLAMGYWDYSDADTTNDSKVGAVYVINVAGEAQTNAGATVYGSLSLSGSDQEIGTGATVTTTGGVVGIKGGFGNVSIGDGGSGAHYGQFAGDRFDVTQGARYRHAIGYTNTFGPVSVRVTTDPSEDGENSFGIKGTFGMVTVGAGQEGDDTTIGASASLGAFGLAIHSTSWDAASTSGVAADDTSLAIKASYSAGDLSASYQTESLDDGDNTRGQLDIAYDLGGSTAVKLRHRTDDVTDSNEYTRLLLSISF